MEYAHNVYKAQLTTYHYWDVYLSAQIMNTFTIINVFVWMASIELMVYVYNARY
jgi:hypothetical protein